MTSDSAAKIGRWGLAVACLSLVATSPLMAQEAGPPQGEGVSTMKTVLLFGIMVSILIPLGLLLWGIKQPLAWIVVSFLAIAAGVGCAAYGSIMYLMYLNSNPPLRRWEVQELSIFFSAGLGSTVAGIVLLVVGLLRYRKCSAAKS